MDFFQASRIFVGMLFLRLTTGRIEVILFELGKGIYNPIAFCQLDLFNYMSELFSLFLMLGIIFFRKKNFLRKIPLNKHRGRPSLRHVFLLLIQIIPL